MKTLSAQISLVVMLFPLLVNGFPERHDSAHLVALSAIFPNGLVRVATEDVANAPYRARDQIMYFVGHLNGFGGGADISKAKITMGAEEARPDGYSDVRFRAEFTVVWPRSAAVPQVLKSVLPVRTDSPGKRDFFEVYGAKCAGGDEPADANTFFYFYRPQNKQCPALAGPYDPEVAMPAEVTLSPSHLQTEGKAPEYHRIWEDKKFVMTMIFGTYADGASSDKDVGVSSYNNVYQSLRRYLGNPTWSNVSLGPKARPGLRYPDIEMTFRLSGGHELNFNMLLIQKSALYKPSEKFLTRYEARTQISDYLSYNGHSGLGSNIRALSKIGKWAEGHYQIFLVNGCDTFTYVDGALEGAVAAANPGKAGTKFLDLITNATPSPFGGFAQNTLAVIRAVLEGRATYRHMLAGFAPSQGALVSGEEDNE